MPVGPFLKIAQQEKCEECLCVVYVVERAYGKRKKSEKPTRPGSLLLLSTKNILRKRFVVYSGTASLNDPRRFSTFMRKQKE